MKHASFGLVAARLVAVPAAALLTLALSSQLDPGPARAQGVDCANPACETKLSARCLDRVGAGAIKAGDDCAAENAAYVACLRSVAETCGGPAEPQAGACSPADARAEWTRLQTSTDVNQLEALAKFCPNTLHGRLAAARAESVKAEAAAAPAPAKPDAPAPRKGGLFGGPAAELSPDVDVQPNGARANARLTPRRGCKLPENASIVLGAWTLQVRKALLGQRLLMVVGRPSEDGDNFVGLEYLESSNGWFRYRAASGDRRTVFRNGREGSQTILTKRFQPKPAAAAACAEYEWAAFDIEIDAREIRIRYQTDGFQYDDETARLDRGDGRTVRFAGRRIDLN